MKAKLYNELLKELGKCEKCINIQKKNGKDCSLMNWYFLILHQ